MEGHSVIEALTGAWVEFRGTFEVRMIKLAFSGLTGLAKYFIYPTETTVGLFLLNITCNWRSIVTNLY